VDFSILFPSQHQVCLLLEQFGGVV